MRFLTSDRVQPGMVLASAVMDRRGRLLIPAGASLTERHVEALGLWGVPHVNVEGDESEDRPTRTLPPEVVEDVEAEIAERFQASGSHPFLSALRACALERALHQRAGREASS